MFGRSPVRGGGVGQWEDMGSVAEFGSLLHGIALSPCRIWFSWQFVPVDRRYQCCHGLDSA